MAEDAAPDVRERASSALSIPEALRAADFEDSGLSKPARAASRPREVDAEAAFPLPPALGFVFVVFTAAVSSASSASRAAFLAAASRFLASAACFFELSFAPSAHSASSLAAFAASALACLLAAASALRALPAAFLEFSAFVRLRGLARVGLHQDRKLPR